MQMEPMEERMEIVLSSSQIFVLSVLVVGVALVMFVVGFSMGKRTEARKVILGNPRSAQDLLSRLDDLEKESREFVAKKALTEIRKREIPLEELPVVERVEPAPVVSGPVRSEPGVQPRVKPLGSRTGGTIALSKNAGTRAPAQAVKKAPATPAPAGGRTLAGSFGSGRRAEPHQPRREAMPSSARNH